MDQGSPSRIPTPTSSLRRSASVRVRGERPFILYSTSPTPFPSIIEKEELSDLSRKYWPPTKKNLSLRSQSQASGLNKHDDDLESVASFTSNVSRNSSRSNCEHSLFAKNGTTYSAKSNKYVVHCSGHCNTPEEYLTPTQRANRNVRRLKTLLQLAKEKLVEKENEIFNLTKEVVELKVFKASIKNGFSEASTPSDCKESTGAICGPATFTVDEAREFPCDSHGNAACGCFDEKLEDDVARITPQEKMSPTSPFHSYQRDHFTATPDYFLSSLADSGHFDDIASTVSMQSKDSLNIQVHAEPIVKLGDEGEERARLVTMYECLLKDQKQGHEDELRSLKILHEENSLKMIDSFEHELKSKEVVFEKDYKALLDATETEKIDIVNKFERRLQEERLIYLEKQNKNKANTYAQTECYNNFIEKVDDEKLNYEKSLTEIKEKFELERKKIEKSFDSVMAIEREKFENAVTKIQSDHEIQIKLVSEKILNTEKRYNELLQKYEESLCKISELEEENSRLRKNISEQDAKQKELYLQMFMKGQEAVKLQQDEAVDGPVTSTSGAIPPPELLVQLKVTEVELENLKDKEYRAQHSGGQGVSLISAKEALSLWMLAARKAMYKRLSEAQQRPQDILSSSRSDSKAQATPGQDPEATLQFLKSAVYYFLTDRDNHLEHLRAIENILGFSHTERKDISTQYVHY